MKKTNSIHFILAMLAVFAVLGIMFYSIFGGSKKRDIIGTWIIDTNHIESGFQCGKGGIAASIRNSTTQYNNWIISQHRLILKGKRFKDGRVTDINDTLTIKRLNSKNLTIVFDSTEMHYRKIR